MEDTKSILMVATSDARVDAGHPTGLWFEEFAVPYERFAEAGYLLTVASIKGGKVPIDPRSLEVAELVAHYLEQGKPVAAVCHGPAALTHAKYRNGVAAVKGCKLTAFSNEEETAVELDALMPFLLEDKLRDLGGEVYVAPQWQAHVVVDANLITGQNPQSSLKTAEALIQALTG